MLLRLVTPLPLLLRLLLLSLLARDRNRKSSLTGALPLRSLPRRPLLMFLYSGRSSSHSLVAARKSLRYTTRSEWEDMQLELLLLDHGLPVQTLLLAFDFSLLFEEFFPLAEFLDLVLPI